MEEAGGSHCSMPHRPWLSRTRFRLGRERDRVPNSKRPESSADQRSPALKVSARRKYSWPKRGSSEMVMEFASSRAPSSRLKSNRPTSTGRPKLASRCEIRYLRAALVRSARESPKLAANNAMAKMKNLRSHFRLRIVRPRIAAKGQRVSLLGRTGTLACPVQNCYRTPGQARVPVLLRAASRQTHPLLQKTDTKKSAMSVNLVKHAGPPCPRRQMKDRVQEVQEPAVEASLCLVLAWTLHRPVDDHGAPHDGIAVHKTPVTTVPAMVAIVAHCKILVRRNHDFAIMDVRKNLFGPLGLHVGLQELFVARRKVIPKRVIRRSRIAGHIRL